MAMDVCCPPVLAGPLTDEEAVQVAALFKALADPARLRLLSLIASCSEQEACVCELTEPVGLAQPTISHHLKVLHTAGLLTRERRGTWMYYRIVPERVAMLRDALVPT
jgi:ArsR family transcriptional regulator, arsenate/arsenite/antimonite-responsive transcriptional repressor